MGRQIGARRIAGIGTSIFTEITALAVEHGAANLGQGFPDFAAPGFVKEAARRHIHDDRNQYAPSAGVPRLRRALSEDYRRRWPQGPIVDPDAEVTVGGGATELLHDALLAIVDPGDEVIVFEPAYDAYAPDVAMAGGVVRAVPLEPPDWRFEPARLAAAFGPRTRALILNAPHLSIATLPGMFERTITVDSMGKTFSVTGWKVGWAIAPPPLTAALRAVHQFVTFTNAAPFQEALADVLPLAARDGYYAGLRANYARRRDLLAAALRGARLDPSPIDGAYFLLADLRPHGVADDVAFCRRLVTEVGVAAIPTSVFYGEPAAAPPFARFCFAKSDDTLRAAAARLAARPPLVP